MISLLKDNIRGSDADKYVLELAGFEDTKRQPSPNGKNRKFFTVGL